MERVYETIECINKAFPHGFSEEEYQSLIAYLKNDFSEQNLAALLSYVNGKEAILVQSDIINCNVDTIMESVVEAMQQAGYKK